MYISRKIIAVWVVCLALILTAVFVRFSRVTYKIGPFPIIVSTAKEKSLPTSQSFYDAGNQETVGNSTEKPIVPVISARAYIAGNVTNGQIYATKNPNLILPVASMSKLITAVAATDRLSLSGKVTVTNQELDVASDTSRFVAGETFSVLELLYPMLLNSSNVAAEALASSTNRAAFLESMTAYAKEIGMPKTFFADPSGLSSQNTSTARDFFTLSKYLYKSRPDILAISRKSVVFIATTTAHNSHFFYSIHPFVTDDEFLGGKTGHTDAAGDTMLTMLRINNQPIAIVVLKSDNRYKDTKLIVEQIRKLI